MMTDKHLTTTDTAEAEQACQRLVLRYAALIDTGAASRVAELVPDDAVWEGGARRWSGIDEIRRGFAGREAMPRISCHLVGPSLVTLTSPRKASATTSYLLLRADRAALRGGPVPASGSSRVLRRPLLAGRQQLAVQPPAVGRHVRLRPRR